MGTPQLLFKPMQKVQNTAARLILRASLSYSNSTGSPLSERIKYKTACMCYKRNHRFRSALIFSELLHLYSPSCSLRSSSDICILKLQRFTTAKSSFRTFSNFSPHIWNSLSSRHQTCSLFLQKQTQDISLLRIFQLSNIVLYPYQS